jgi:hypothetical protein
MKRTVITRADVLPLLSSPRIEIVNVALNMLRSGASPEGPMQPWGQETRGSTLQSSGLSSAEAAPLLTNQLMMAQLAGLKVLQQNADAEALELTLPFLRHTNSVLRSRAFRLCRTVSGKNISQNDPVLWEQWWATNKSDFVPGR